MQSVNIFFKNKFVTFRIYQHFLLLKRFKRYWKNMDSQLLQPSNKIKYMKKLDRKMFDIIIDIPCLQVCCDNVNKIFKALKKFVVKMENLKPIQITNATDVFKSTNTNENAEEIKKSDRVILLQPAVIKSWSDLPLEVLTKYKIDEKQFYYKKVKLNYKNWRADLLLKAILPNEDEGVTSYSQVGHIIHLNLREELSPYKQIIGEILLDKVATCRTVVNKVSNIENVYRNLELELICGDFDYCVKTKENGVTYEFDYSKVYWNPRLSTEHMRIINTLQENYILFDVFAGVGPFAIPAALRKKCTVFANDLNPESFKWLKHNLKLNKCLDRIQIFNKDGRAFLENDVKRELLKYWTKHNNLDKQSNDGIVPKDGIHITMNLPALAFEFIDVFCGLFREEWLSNIIKFHDIINGYFNYPIVHLYIFLKCLDFESESTSSRLRHLLESKLNTKIFDKDILKIHFVRKVSPSKEMYCISFRLNKNILITSAQQQFDTQLNKINNYASIKRLNDDNTKHIYSDDEGDNRCCNKQCKIEQKSIS